MPGRMAAVAATEARVARDQSCRSAMNQAPNAFHHRTQREWQGHSVQSPQPLAGTARDTTDLQTLPWYSRRAYYVEGWTDAAIWRSAAAYVGIFNTFLLASFIYATATATGGHSNPMITLTTILCGLTPVFREARRRGPATDKKRRRPDEFRVVGSVPAGSNWQRESNSKGPPRDHQALGSAVVALCIACAVPR